MFKSKLIFAGTSAAALLALAHCGSSSPSTTDNTGGMTATGGGTSTGGATNTGGATTNTGGATTNTGGATTNTGGATTNTGGTQGGGGMKAMGGMSNPTGGAGGTPAATGGMSGVDEGGVPLAKVGDSTTTTKKYLNLGDMRLINNRWGSDEINCTNSNQKVVVNSDMTFGWEFDRPSCAGDDNHAKPDYPEVEFGVAPFGKKSSLLTSPAYSSTKLLPIQLKDLKSATLTFDNFNTTLQNPTYWDTNFEFWISKQNPLTSDDAGVFAEIIIFLGWNTTRNDGNNGGWACMKSGTVGNFNLCHQDDAWAGGKWRFYNFLVSGNSMPNYSGKADVKAILDWVMKNYSGFTQDMWLTRIEVGAEINNNTKGTTKIKNLTFEINGDSKSAQLAK